MKQEDLVKQLNDEGVSLTQFRNAWKTGIAAEFGSKFSVFVSRMDDTADCIACGFNISKQSGEIDWTDVYERLLTKSIRNR